MRKLTANQQRFFDLVTKERWPHVKAYREAYRLPDLRPKDASNRARRLMNTPHFAARLQAFEDEVQTQIVTKQSALEFSYKEEVRDNLRCLFEVALEKRDLRIALDTVRLMGAIDGCGNFISEKAARYETIININFMTGLHELLRIPGVVDAHSLRELIVHCVEGDDVESVTDPAPRSLASAKFACR